MYFLKLYILAMTRVVFILFFFAEREGHKLYKARNNSARPRYFGKLISVARLALLRSGINFY